MNTIEMFSLDFEEFVMALKIKKEILNGLYKSFVNKLPVDEFVHNRMLEAFRSYLLVGGMPEE